MAEDPDLELVRALQGGDELALNVLMARHKEPLFRFLFRYTRNETAARDLAQEAFVRAYFNIRSFKPRAKFTTWLFQIALNLCRDLARSKHHKRSFLHASLSDSDRIGAHEPADVSANPRQRAIGAEQLAVTLAAIDNLPHDLRVALILGAIEERSQQEVAELLGVSVKAVETRIYRARQTLREALG